MTRADFYIGRGPKAKWIGSIAGDGYPAGIVLTTDKPDPDWPVFLGRPPFLCEPFPPGQHLFDAASPRDFRARLKQYFANRGDVTLPRMGWPWPWEDSRTTDYAYAFDGGNVWASCFGHEWFDPRQKEPDDDEAENTAVFPNMKARAKVTMGRRSGLIVAVDV